MGLFDKLKDVVKDVTGEDPSKLKEKLEGIVGDVKSNASASKTIPEEYSHFPVFDGEIGDLNTKKESKYKRCTINYYKANDDEVEEYRKKVVSEGYKKASKVRYEKDNEYIIIDEEETPLHLVYHIKL